MKKPIATIIMIFSIVACSTNYKLKDTANPISLEAYSSFECSSETNTTNGQGLDLCESFGLKGENRASCVANDQSCTRIHVIESVYFLDASPGIILFFGLIPSTQRYSYEVELTRINQSGSEHRYIEKFEIIESWGMLNSLKRLFGGLNSKENEQNKIGSFLRGKYGLYI